MGAASSARLETKVGPFTVDFFISITGRQITRIVDEPVTVFNRQSLSIHHDLSSPELAKCFTQGGVLTRNDCYTVYDFPWCRD